jgi:hypothetical protein
VSFVLLLNQLVVAKTNPSSLKRLYEDIIFVCLPVYYFPLLVANKLLFLISYSCYTCPSIRNVVLNQYPFEWCSGLETTMHLWGKVVEFQSYNVHC